MTLGLFLTFLVGLIGATLRVATPLIFATVGEVYTERVGILNLGIEGIMFLGAFVGFAVAFKANEAGLTTYLWIGLLGAAISGIVMSLLMGFFTVTLGVNQHVSGLGITLLSIGLSLFGFRLVFGESSVLPSIDPFPQFSIFGDLPILGPIFKQYALTYIAFIVLIPLASWMRLTRAAAASRTALVVLAARRCTGTAALSPKVWLLEGPHRRHGKRRGRL